VKVPLLPQSAAALPQVTVDCRSVYGNFVTLPHRHAAAKMGCNNPFSMPQSAAYHPRVSINLFNLFECDSVSTYHPASDQINLLSTVNHLLAVQLCTSAHMTFSTLKDPHMSATISNTTPMHNSPHRTQVSDPCPHCPCCRVI
jgi:hypothetical protein